MTDEKFDDEADSAAEDEFLIHREAIHDLMDEYAIEHDLSAGFASDLALDVGLQLRMIAYCLDTAKPSGSGLKLELDRCRRELEETFRDYNKTADEIVRSMKETIEAAQRGEEEPGQG
jgi:hypothetical protein